MGLIVYAEMNLKYSIPMVTMVAYPPFVDIILENTVRCFIFFIQVNIP